MPTNGSSSAFFNLSVAGDGRDFAIGGIFPDGVIASFAHQIAAVRTQVALEVKALHEVAS